MARRAAARRLNAAPRSARYGFAVAGPQDAGDVARLLRDVGFEGRYALALARDPDPYALDACGEGRFAFVVARDPATGKVAGICERVVRELFVDGAPTLVPYYGALRLAPSHRGRIGVIRGGFAAMKALGRDDEAPFAFTSIAQGNEAATRLLLAGLDGLPRYQPIRPYTTYALRPVRSRPSPSISSACEGELAEVADYLNARNAAQPLAPVWSEARLKALAGAGLPCDSILIWREAGTLRGCVGLWDQRRLRQTVIRAYPRVIGAARRMLNALAPLIGVPDLPPIGATVAQATLALVAADAPEVFAALLAAALDLARRRGFSAVMAGCADGACFGDVLRGRRAFRYPSVLYAIDWRDRGADCAVLRSGVAAPELGWL